MVQMVSALAYRYWDLGSIPRSPTSSILFFFICFHAAPHLKSMIHAYVLACQVARGPNAGVRTCRSPYTLVNHAHVTTEKSKRPHSMGLIAANIPPNGSENPPCLPFLSLFLFFPFIYFNYYLFYLIPQINFL